MTNFNGVAVTYTGTDAPFKDRIYRSGLTFTEGQTRVLPAPLAARFLRHADVFQPAGAGPSESAANELPADDTAEAMAQQQQEIERQREREDARFALLDQIESMDKKMLEDWAEVNFKQKLDGRMSLRNMRDAVKGFVDQYGMP